MSDTMGFFMGLGPAATAVEVTAVRRVTPPLLDTEGGFRATWLYPGGRALQSSTHGLTLSHSSAAWR